MSIVAKASSISRRSCCGQRDVGGRQVVIEMLNLVPPGIGTIHGFWASNQASAICAGVMFLRAARSFRKSTTLKLASSASGVKRGKSFRRSFGSSNFMSLVILPVRKPCPSGPQATRPMPSSSQSANFVVLGLAHPQRVVVLDGGHRLYGVGLADVLRRSLPTGRNG